MAPFTISLADEVLEDLRNRLARTRFADVHAGVGPEWGLDPATLRMLIEHWRAFDWRKAEAEVNAVPAFRTEVDGVGLHFVHVRGQGGTRVPIVLTNGWPSCFTELLPMVPLLTRVENGVSFDVVIPSLPGYGFSDRPREPGTNITRIASLWARLMTMLGYERFIAHGSDMGAGVVERLRALHADRLLGAHMINVFHGYPPPARPSLDEREYLQRAASWQMAEGAYAMLQATKPHTIAAALTDSPAGLAAWIGEKFRAWTDSSGKLDGAVSLDALCTILTIYWATETIASSQRLYREAFADVGAMSPPPKAGAPLGIAIFPADILPAPRAWAERWFDVTRWSQMARGGHFPGLEAPELLAADLRSFAGALTPREASSGS
ncbi:MAG: epoxide hydrolase [Polyangiaceae bacterium]|nr:epoxide hydrolase [Polyangiaceae bacterium]